MKPDEHWEKIYSTKDATKVSWFQAHAHLSLKLIRQGVASKSASIIDVGGGASTLVDDLLGNGFDHITVLDLSHSALETARSRLGPDAAKVNWVEESIFTAQLPKHAYDVWHDRAVFHFLVTDQEREAYVKRVLHAVKPQGLVIVATFAEDGPTKCSGLPVMRYSAKELEAEFGDAFRLLGHQKEVHITPGGAEQKFVYCIFRKVVA